MRHTKSFKSVNLRISFISFFYFFFMNQSSLQIISFKRRLFDLSFKMVILNDYKKNNLEETHFLKYFDSWVLK